MCVYNTLTTCSAKQNAQLTNLLSVVTYYIAGLNIKIKLSGKQRRVERQGRGGGFNSAAGTVRSLGNAEGTDVAAAVGSTRRR